MYAQEFAKCVSRLCFAFMPYAHANAGGAWENWMERLRACACVSAVQHTGSPRYSRRAYCID